MTFGYAQKVVSQHKIAPQCPAPNSRQDTILNYGYICLYHSNKNMNNVPGLRKLQMDNTTDVGYSNSIYSLFK